MTVLKKQGMYSLSCTTDLPPVCPKGTGSTVPTQAVAKANLERKWNPIPPLWCDQV